MSETTSDYDDDSKFTVSLNDKVYELNEDIRDSLETRAELAYDENHMFTCWWRVADEEDEADSNSVHQEGDPILVIETEGPIVPWERLDQLEMEMQDMSSFQDVDSGSGSDVSEGNGMKTIEPDKVKDDVSNEEQEKSRTHFSVTPRDFEEMPSPDGESPEKIPPKPQDFDEPKMVMWIPNDPDIEHRWSTGEAIAPMYNWVEWNVQQKANQPRKSRDKDTCHNQWESLLKSEDCEVVAKLAPAQNPPPSDDSKSVSDDDVDQKFKDGIAGGNNWTV